MQRLLTTENAKILKSRKLKYLTAGVMFAPNAVSGYNVCPMASEGCKLSCLSTSGNGRYARVQLARIQKTKRFFEDREGFMKQLIHEIELFDNKAKRIGFKTCIRLNIVSDVAWERILYKGKNIFEHFPRIQFMDYTKIPSRMMPDSKASKYSNYHLTFSRSESNHATAEMIAAMGHNVAVVFKGELPKKYMGRSVFSGDKHDLRFLDKKGIVVGLTPKGRAKRDVSGFVVEI